MVRIPKVTMTMRELDRLKCVQGVVDRQRKLYQAAERLGLATRQVRRLVRRYQQEGPVGLISSVSPHDWSMQALTHLRSSSFQKDSCGLVNA